MDWRTDFGFESYQVEVDGHRLHVCAAGSGPPMVFLHGNPTHSFLWRHVMTALAPHWRCLAIDLAGFGASATPANPLRIVDHARLVSCAVRRLTDPSERLAWVAHDWGVAIAFQAAGLLADYPHQAVAFTEGHVRWIPSWDDADPGFAGLFGRLREAEFGEDFVVASNRFVEEILLGALPGLDAAEQDVYRGPFTDPERRYGVLELARQVPVAGEPADLVPVLDAVALALSDPALPKLLMLATPGAVIDALAASWIRARSRNLATVGIGEARHFTPEEQHGAIASAIGAWLYSPE